MSFLRESQIGMVCPQCKEHLAAAVRVLALRSRAVRRPPYFVMSLQICRLITK